MKSNLVFNLVLGAIVLYVAVLFIYWVLDVCGGLSLRVSTYYLIFPYVLILLLGPFIVSLFVEMFIALFAGLFVGKNVIFATDSPFFRKFIIVFYALTFVISPVCAWVYCLYGEGYLNALSKLFWD